MMYKKWKINNIKKNVRNFFKNFIPNLSFFYNLDRLGFVFFVVAIIILLISPFIHGYLSAIYKETFVDRLASLSLIFFLVSEFRLSSMSNKYTTEQLNMQFKFDIKKLIIKLNSINKKIKNLENILLVLERRDTVDISCLSEKIKQIIKSNELKDEPSFYISGKKVIISELSRKVNFLQYLILLFILISTVLWGFGTLIMA